MRPTIALCMIVKNEAHNLGQLFRSIEGCFDEIHVTDTGSTDHTVGFLEQINKNKWPGLPEIKIHKFEWVNDFAKAREFSFSHAKTDYAMWLDGDDVLSDPKAFTSWRDTVMHSAHYWLAVYNYAFNAQGAVECQFVRERVVKLNHGFHWKYFVHEGIVQEEGRKYWPQRVTSWAVNHMRTEEDKKNDHMRNINLIDRYKDQDMPARMKFYHGKELVENGFAKDAGKPLMEAIASPDLEIHDKILAIQYAAQSAFQCGAYQSAIDLLMLGIKNKIDRAEYWCLLGDCYLTVNMINEAIQAYKVALNSKMDTLGGIVVCAEHAYTTYPQMKLAEIFMAVGKYEEAGFWIDALKNLGHDSAAQFETQLTRLIDIATIRKGLPKTSDVVITCQPGGVVTDWDENTLEAKGHGGSETAAIEVARWIKKKTGRNVKIFHSRAKRDVMPSGVEYLPSDQLLGYLQNVEPHAHIAWRHAIRLTHANSYVWCHDLQCPGGELIDNYEKIVALSGFHASYLQETNGVPRDKIVLGFNGVNPLDFVGGDTPKDDLKVVFSSSPDRGLVQTIEIVKCAREISGLDIKLHCFYGTDNMRKMGHTEWADQIEKAIADNSEFVVYHGHVNKKTLMKHFKESAVWLYPADFIESYCITAIEAMCAGVWPIVRDMGALKFTMKDAIAKDCCDILSVEVKDQASVGLWAHRLVDAILDKKYQKMSFDANDYSWEKVADFFCEQMNITPLTNELEERHARTV